MKVELFIKIIFVSFWFFSLTAWSQNNVIAKLSVKSGDFKRQDRPVWVDMDTMGIIDFSDLALLEIKGNQRTNTPFQIEGSTHRLWWILSGITDVNSTRIFELQTGNDKLGKNKKRILDITEFDKGLRIGYKGTDFVQYNSLPVALPVNVDSVFTRGAFIHPLWSPSGQILTREFPEDHYHHVGIWNPWTKTKFEGREIDFWNLAKKQGTVRFKQFTAIERGPVFGGFNVLQEHIDLAAPKGEKVAINEEWEIKVYQPGEKNATLYFVDFISKLQCADSIPILLEKYRYGGGIGFRATELWTKDNCNVLTSEGKTRRDGDASRAKWCNVFGTIDEMKSGILFLSDPENFSFPQPMRIWPNDAIDGKGLFFFQFCPIRENNWQLSPGEVYLQKYRLVVYDGEIPEKTAELLWQDYAHPPEVLIQKENQK